MPSYKHVFFDLDHTLWDFDTNANATLSELFLLHKLEERTKAPFNDFYVRYMAHNAHLWDRYEKGFIGVEELKLKRMWRTLLDFKIADEELSNKLSYQFLEILPTKNAVFPYTPEILQYLKNKGYLMHLITNGFERIQRKKLSNSGIDGFFTHLITSEISNSLKPKKEIFDFAVNLSEALLEESIMIGDNLNADVQGALNAGMDAVYVNHINADAGPVKPTYTITHLQQLEDIL
jgi:putative hydrolase of the HAD superfamily